MAENYWDDDAARDFAGPLAQRVYTSRLLGRDHALVLHGGGNTSVKIRERNIFGDEEDILYVKGSGWDLETIEAAGFAPVRLERSCCAWPRSTQLSRPADGQGAARGDDRPVGARRRRSRRSCTRSCPYRFVDHTHADALLAVTNTADGERRVREIYGDAVVVVPYVMPGFDLARLCAERFRDRGRPEDGRHGAAEPRVLLLRRHGARVLRADDRAGRRAPRRTWQRRTRGDVGQPR